MGSRRRPRRDPLTLRSPVPTVTLAWLTGSVEAALARHLAIDPSAIVLERRCSRCAGRDHGKPTLAGEHRDELHFSVSRSRGAGIIAMSSTHAVGVDIERLRSIDAPERLAAQLFAPSDAATVTTSAELLRAWVHKEAVLKATGVGITSAGLRAPNRPATGWRTIDIDAGPGHVAALAVPTAVGRWVQCPA